MNPDAFFDAAYSNNAGVLGFPFGDFNGLAASEADALTGDARRVIRAFVEMFATSIQNQVDPVENVTVTKANPVGIGDNRIRQTYTFSFDMEYSDAEVIA